MSAVLLCFASLSWLPGRAAHADETRLILMREPSPYTDVIDAADDDDRFDISAHLGYARSIDRGTLQREHTTAQGERKRSTFAHGEQVVSQLQLGVDVGLYKDWMAFLRLPLVLRDTRSLKRAEGVSTDFASALLSDPVPGSAELGSLMQLPVLSPSRAGFDYVGFGTALAVTSQERKPWLPTWVVMIEGRRAVGRLIRPCVQDAAGDNECRRDPGDAVQGPLVAASKKTASGVSRGVSALSVETRVSKRFRYFEPYAGLAVLVEWASTAKKYFAPSGRRKGLNETAPPRQFTATLGSQFVPWEHRGRFQRAAADLRLYATYLTRGRDYTMLFDALGTSSHPALSGPADGVTEVGSAMRIGARLGMEVRAARYIRFAFGAGLSGVSAHPLTAASPCSTSARGGSDSGVCQGFRPDPSYRATIDAPGRRFWIAEQLLIDLYASATAQF